MTAAWCLCGAQAGYPHDPRCPRPIYYDPVPTADDPAPGELYEWRRQWDAHDLGKPCSCHPRKEDPRP